MSKIKNSFRQVCDKPCINKICFTEWSPKRDLIAVITVNGDVRLHRLYWQKVWVMPVKQNKATKLAWKPDGKLLAVGYCDGTVNLVEIEKAVIMHTVKCDKAITSLHWSVKENKEKYIDFNEQFLPTIDKDDVVHIFENLNALIESSSSKLNILTAGTEDGNIHLFTDGIFPIFSFSVSSSSLINLCIIKTNLDLKEGKLTVVFSGRSPNDDEDDKCVYFQTLSSQLLSTQISELSYVSKKLTKIIAVVEKCEKVIKQMTDASDDVCLRINAKLEKLEHLLAPSGVSVAAAFTLAYVIGEAKAEMQTFLTQHLTAKGLKQISQNVRLSYSSLQTDISDEFLPLLQHLHFHITELRGMEEMFTTFGSLGIVKGLTKNTSNLLHQLTLKTHVLLQVVSSDMKNFQIFFMWLINFIFRITGEENPIAFKQFTNEEYDCMLEFLEFRLLKNKNSGKGYDLERVSQFFRIGDLDFLEDTDNNSWINYVNSNEILKNNALVVEPNSKASLLELFTQFKLNFDIIYNSVQIALSNSIIPSPCVKLYKKQPNHDISCKPSCSFLQRDTDLLMTIVCCSCDSDNMFLICFKNNSSNVRGLLIESDRKDMDITGQATCTLHDATFYNNENITVLYEVNDNEKVMSVFGQIPLQKILDFSPTKISIDPDSSVLDTVDILNWVGIRDVLSEQRSIDGFSANALSVNGYSRKVTCLISSCNRRVQVFDMTAEDDNVEEFKLSISQESNTEDKNSCNS